MYIYYTAIRQSVKQEEPTGHRKTTLLPKLVWFLDGRNSSVSKSPMCKLNLQKKWPHETPFTKEAHTFTLGLSLNGSSFGI